jgi:hypothetical protein
VIRRNFGPSASGIPGQKLVFRRLGQKRLIHRLMI